MILNLISAEADQKVRFKMYGFSIATHAHTNTHACTDTQENIMHGLDFKTTESQGGFKELL